MKLTKTKDINVIDSNKFDLSDAKPLDKDDNKLYVFYVDFGDASIDTVSDICVNLSKLLKTKFKDNYLIIPRYNGFDNVHIYETEIDVDTMNIKNELSKLQKIDTILNYAKGCSDYQCRLYLQEIMDVIYNEQ